jgi:hypothetical protein
MSNDSEPKAFRVRDDGRFIPPPAKRQGRKERPSEKVFEDPVVHDIQVHAFEREWKSLQDRYGHLPDFATTVARDLGLS